MSNRNLRSGHRCTRKKYNLPVLLVWILKKMISTNDYHYAIGDLEETFTQLIRETNKFKAYCWIWLECIRSLPRFIKIVIYWRAVMFKNNIKIAVRNLVKYKVYSVINISGFAVGLAAVILMTLYIRYEFSFDKTHKNHDQIFRVERKVEDNRGTDVWRTTPFPTAPTLASEFPEIIHYFPGFFDLPLPRRIPGFPQRRIFALHALEDSFRIPARQVSDLWLCLARSPLRPRPSLVNRTSLGAVAAGLSGKRS